MADELLGSEIPAERAAGVRVAAAVAAHDGNYRQAAELFSWLGHHPDAVVGAAATIAHLGVGDAAAAAAAPAVGHPGPPDRDGPGGATPGRGVTRHRHGPIRWPRPVSANQRPGVHHLDRDAGFGGSAGNVLAALHNGDVTRAHSVIVRAIAADTDPVFVHRHRLLRSWAQMQEGRFGAAAEGTARRDTAPPRRAVGGRSEHGDRPA